MAISLYTMAISLYILLWHCIWNKSKNPTLSFHFTAYACVPLKDVESYIHRSGRTGRAGRTGVCICFYQRKEEDQLRYVENKAVCCGERRSIEQGPKD